MSANLRNYTKAVYAFDHVVKLAKEPTYRRKAPCAGWTGADVYDHVVSGLAMVRSFAMTGHGPKRSPSAGKDRLATWAKWRDDTLESLDHPHVLQSTAHDPFGPEFGPMPVDTLIGFMAAELAVHTWDLARTAKVDERLDPGLVRAATATWKELPDQVLRMEGMMGPAVKPARGADAQTKLLNLLGRTV